MYFNQRPPVVPGHYSKFQCRQLCSGSSFSNHARGIRLSILNQPVSQRVRPVCRRTINPCVVSFLDGSLTKLIRKPRRSFARSSVKRNPGNGAIEPMNDSQKNIALLVVFFSSPTVSRHQAKSRRQFHRRPLMHQRAWQRPGSDCRRKEFPTVTAWKLRRGCGV